jgi:methylaspartate mutase epsilon subunit
MVLSQRKWDEDFFLAEVRKHLDEWPSGREINLDEVLQYHRAMPAEKNFVKASLKAQQEDRCLLGIVTGKPSVKEQTEELKYVEPEVDYFQIVADSLTRNRRYKEAEEGLKRGQAAGKNIINGFPFVIHGMAVSRTVVESVKCPIQTPLPITNGELTGITAAASGVSHFSYNISLSLAQDSHASLERMVLYCQFLDRMLGYFQEKGISFSKYPTTLTAAPLPAGLSLAWLILDALMAAEQGVKHFEIFYPVNSCIIQDLAALKVARPICEGYLRSRGHQDVRVYISSCTNVSAFPRDTSKALSRVLFDTVIAAYAKSVRHHFKTGEEAFGIPSKEATLQAAKAVRMMMNMVWKESFPEDDNFKLEAKMIELETMSIVNKVMDIGDGDVIKGMIKSLELGLLDIPYCVSTLVPGKVLAMRDARRAVRYLQHGNLPLSFDILEYHREKIAERRQREVKKSDWDMIIEDIKAEAEA